MEGVNVNVGQRGDGNDVGEMDIMIDSDVESTGGSSVDEFVRQMEDVWRQVERDDADLTELSVGLYEDYSPPDGEWAPMGAAIGRNTHLRALSISDPDWDMSEESLQALFGGGVASNRSIRKLVFRGCNLFDGEIFATLATFFDGTRLDCLEVLSCHLQPKCLSALASALLAFDTLENFRLTHCNIGFEGAGGLMAALAPHSNLTKLDLVEVFTGTGGCTELASLLDNPNSKLATLDLRYNGFVDEGAVILAAGLRKNKSLKEIDMTKNRDMSGEGWHSIFTALHSSDCILERVCLYNNYINGAARSLGNALTNMGTLKVLNIGCNEDIDIRGWRAVFESLRSPNCKLEDIDLSSSWLTDEAILSLADALSINRTLRCLDISDNSEISNAGWGAVAAVLRGNGSSALEELNMSCNALNDRAVGILSNALISNSRLTDLDLCGNTEATPLAWEAFSAVLANPMSALQRLNLDHNQVDDGTLASLADSLENNTVMTELIIYDQSPITSNGWSAISRLLCNKSSILATYQTNHTLQRIYSELREDRLPEEIRSLLQLNRNNSKREAARRKIFMTHFSTGFVVPPFVDMDVKVLPFALAWMGRDGEANGTTCYHLYGFLRSMPLLFDVRSKSR